MMMLPGALILALSVTPPPAQPEDLSALSLARLHRIQEILARRQEQTRLTLEALRAQPPAPQTKDRILRQHHLERLELHLQVLDERQQRIGEEIDWRSFHDQEVRGEKETRRRALEMERQQARQRVQAMEARRRKEEENLALKVKSLLADPEKPSEQPSGAPPWAHPGVLEGGLLALAGAGFWLWRRRA